MKYLIIYIVCMFGINNQTIDFPRNVTAVETSTTTALIIWDETDSYCNYLLRYRIRISPGVYAEWQPWQNYNGGQFNSHLFEDLEPATFYQYEIFASIRKESSQVVTNWFETK
ncbi:MAG TPA: fibronectin type III domain-containing protein [Saprospiraceae bacterium]|nr:fibronectin type III domain-containing protein [Saprospiraceae bacterium]